MKAIVKNVAATECVLEIEPQYADELSALTDKECEIKIEEIGEKWSLRALHYAWHLTDELAKALRMKRDEIHFQSLRDYAPRYAVTLFDFEKITDFGFKYYEFAGFTGECSQYIVYRGFRDMNSKQMARVIDGLEMEAKQLDIPTKSSDEIKHILEEWSNEENAN